MKYFLEKYHRIIIILVLGFTLTVSLLNADQDSLTYDEDAHIPAGYSYLKERDMRLNPEHPPLLKNLAAFPLVFLDLNFDTAQPFWEQNANDAQWNAGKYFLFGAGNDPDLIIFLSRLSFILIYLFLALFIFKWARELSGTVGGLIAFLLFALDPNILGHNHLVTTDLGIAAFLVPAFYFFLRFIKNPSWKNTLIFGSVWGILQLVKFSSVLTLPIFGLILVVYPLIKLNSAGQETRWREKLKFLGEAVGKGLVALFLSLLLVWIAYYFNTSKMPAEKLPEIVNYYFSSGPDNAGKAYVKKIVFSLNDSAIFRPLAAYFFGVARVFQRVAGGNMTYFFGEINTRGFLAYFPVLLLIKLPLPSLLLVFFSLALGMARVVLSPFRHLKNFGKYLKTLVRNHIAELSLLLFVVLYLVSSIFGRLNIGIRHLFPIFPPVFILTAAAVAGFIRRTHDRKEKSAFYFSLVLLFFFLAAEIASVYPYYLSYFNQAAGGPKNGYRFVTDSNADWGQDLKRLALFLEQHPEIQKIRLNYFGMADPDYYLPNKFDLWWDAKRPVQEGWYGISTLFLQESLYDLRRSETANYSWLKNKKPAFQVGTSILLYYISAEEASLANNPAF